MHEGYVRLVPGAKVAVLMVHGIVGTPRHFDFLLDEIPENVAVNNLLLAGHGGTVKDFAKASMKQWRKQVSDALAQLCANHEAVIIVAHSMGTLLTAEAVKLHPRVEGMLLMNVPLRVQVAPRMMLASMRWCFGKLRKLDPHDDALKNCSGVEPTWKLWQYLSWLPRFWELLQICKAARPIFASALALPVYAFQSCADEVVRRSSSRYLLKNEHIKHTMLSDCGHFFYTDEARNQMRQAMKELLNESETRV